MAQKKKKIVTAVAKHKQLLNTASQLFNKQADVQRTEKSYLISAWVQVRTHLRAQAQRTNRDNSSERSVSHYVRWVPHCVGIRYAGSPLFPFSL